MQGYVVGSIDVAALVLYAFALFFLFLVFYLRREDRREGYPMEDELSGIVESPGGALHTASVKAFLLPNGHGVVAIAERREATEIAGRRRENFSGAPYYPTQRGLPVGIGPGAYAQRAQYPDPDAEGRPRIIPLSIAEGMVVARQDTDPRGMPVIGADGRQAGTVTDLWVDRGEHVFRYLQVETGSGAILAPMAMAVIRGGAVRIDAINAADFAGAPKTASGTQITRDEEERIVAYFGAGYLYANGERQEPWL
jgi:photosynthetic reaction center H subunit